MGMTISSPTKRTLHLRGRRTTLRSQQNPTKTIPSQITISLKPMTSEINRSNSLPSIAHHTKSRPRVLFAWYSTTTRKPSTSPTSFLSSHLHQRGLGLQPISYLYLICEVIGYRQVIKIMPTYSISV